MLSLKTAVALHLGAPPLQSNSLSADRCLLAPLLQSQHWPAAVQVLSTPLESLPKNLDSWGSRSPDHGVRVEGSVGSSELQVVTPSSSRPNEQIKRYKGYQAHGAIDTEIDGYT